MEKILRLFLKIEIALGVLFTLRVLATGNNDWGVLYIILLFIGANAILALPGLWALFAHPPLRRLAAYVTLTPVGFVIGPVMLRSAMDSGLGLDVYLSVAAVAAVCALIWAVLKPKRAGRFVPQSMFASRWFNVTIVAVVVLGWIMPVFVYLFLAMEDTGSRGGGQGSPGMGAAVVILLAGMYLLGLGGASLLSGAWGWLGFRNGEAGRRGIHVVQMLISVPGMVVGGFVWAWLSGQGLV